MILDITFEENEKRIDLEFVEIYEVENRKRDQAKTVTPSEATQVIAADINKLLSKVIVEPIPSEYVVPQGSYNVTDNGNYDITEYAKVNVNVEKGVFPSGTLQINSNGNYDATNYERVNVEVPNGVEEITITQNGVYEPSGNNIGFSKVTVSTEGIIPSGTLEITANGTYDVTQYANAKVDFDTSTLTTLKKLLDTTKRCYQLFYGFTLTDVSDLIAYSDTENVENMSSMFSYSENLINAPQLDTRNVTDMSSMFNQCKKLTNVPQFDTRNVTNMSGMFYYCYYLINAPQLDTRNVTNMGSMFSECHRLTNVPLYDTRNVTNIAYMFSNCCDSLTNVPQFDTSSCTNMSSMFNQCKKLTNVPQFDTRNVTNMSSMFSYSENLINAPQLDTRNVTNMSSMFNCCYKLLTIDITKFANNNSKFAFWCYSLTKLIIRTMDTIPSLSSNAFNGCYHFTGTVSATYNPEGLKDGRMYVPDDKVEELKITTNWSIYADIIVPLSTLEE